MSLRCLPSSFSSIQLTLWEEMSYEEFQDGRCGDHLGYQNGTILAILNLHVSPMPPIKFQHNLIYRSRADVVRLFPRCPPWRPSWISERKDFSNSESPCRPNTSHQVCAQSDTVREQIWFEDFQDGGHLGYGTELF